MSLSYYFHQKDQKMTPEHRLWFAVLLQMISDIKITCTEKRTRCSYLNPALVKEKREFLNCLNDGGLETVCSVVGIDWGQYKKSVTAIANSTCCFHGPGRKGPSSGPKRVRKVYTKRVSTRRLNPLSKQRG